MWDKQNKQILEKVVEADKVEKANQSPENENDYNIVEDGKNLPPTQQEEY